jgi:hypothetical protein
MSVPFNVRGYLEMVYYGNIGINGQGQLEL